MSDCDTIYWYCNIKLLSSELQSAEQQALKRLKSTKKSFDCTVCRKKVELNYRQGLSVSLQKHICNTQKSQGTTGPAKNILQEYELYQSVRYTNKIKEKLFFKDPENKYYLYTINIVDDIILCLICDCEIPGKANVMQHVNGSRHIKGLQQDYDVVLAFHKYFEKLKEEYQVLQRDFCIYDHTSIQCMLCSRILLLQNVKQHIEGPCFAMKRDNQDVIPVKYDPHIMATIYKDLLEYCLTVDDVNCLLLQNFGNGIYCLLCNANVTKHIYIHLDSSIHQANLANTKTLESLKQYHQIWTALPLHVQVEQTYFRRREQKITCTVCSTFFPYDADVLANHVNSMNHKMFLMKMKNTDDVSMNSQKQSSQSVSSRSTSVETDRTTSLSTSSSSSNIGNRNGANSAAKPDIGTPPIPSSPSYTNVPASLGIAKIPYDKSVLEELYPDGLMLFTVTMGTVKYPIIIKRETSKHCFICNADVSTPVLLHANSPEHIAHMGSDRRRELLKKFHDLWISLPQSDQCRQIAFKIEDDLVCMLCDKRMAYDIKELKSHIESWGHLQKVMTNGILNDFKQVPNFSQTLSNGIVPNSAASTVSNTIVDNRVDVSNEKPKSLQDLLSSVKNSNKQEINKSPEKKAENCSTKSGTVTYSKKVLNDLYGDELIHYYIRIGDVKYPLIQNMGTYKRCLICNIDLISSVLFHMNSLPHIHSRSHPEKIKQLKKYHDLWLNFSESDQLEQKYFEIGEKLTCTLCQKELEYDEEALTAHIFSIGHRNETWCLNNESSTVSGRLIDMLNSTEVDDSSDDEVIEGEPVEEQTPVSSKSNETSAIREIDSNSVVQPVNAHDIIFYDTSTLQTVYNNLLRYVVLIKNKRYFFIQNRHESKYCLICQLTFSDIDQHINSSQHRRNAANGVYVKRVRTYHSLFMSLNAKFHKEQIYFEPKENGVRCIVCQSNSLTRLPLMEHLNSHKHIRMVELQGLKISNFKSVPEANFTSKERKAIHHTALQSLKSNLEQYTVAVNNTYYYYIQNRGNSQYCLICKMVINDLNLHVSTLQHVGNLSNPTVLASLRKYYLLFWSVALHLQLEQIHFVPDQHGVKCLKCDFVCYTTELLKNHLNSKMHEENQHERIPEINSVEAVHEVSEDVSESDVMKQETCPTVRDNLLEYIIIIQGLGYFYIQNRHDSLYCLICRLTIKNAAEHVKSAEHLNNEKDDSILKSVRRYHELFAVLNRKSKRQQIHFAPHSNGVNCIKCDVFCATAIEIVEHLESFAHSGIYEIKPNTAMLLEDDVAVQEESPSNLYFDETLDVIYPNLTQYSIDVDNMTYPCIQKRSRGLFCLICQTALHSPIETHVTNESHIKRCQNPLFRKMISDYHKAFSELSSKQQLQQTEFELYADKLVCIPCDKVRPPTASSIKEHLESAQHYQNVMKIGRILEKSQHTRLTKEEAKDFSRFLLQSLNANLRQHAVIIKRCSYYYLQNRRKYKYCLICQMTIEDVDIHVDSLEHNVKKVDDQSLKSVRSFHLLFDNLPLELRIEQVHFAPAGRGVRCLLCEEMYSSLLPLKRHLKSPTHRDTSNVRRSEYSVVEADVLENISCLSEVSSDEEAPEELPTPAVVEGGDINNDSTTKICDNKYVLEHFNKSYCLLCEMHFAPGHLTTKRHLKKLDKTTNVNSVLHKRVETFLRNWDQVAPAYQHMKNEFLPASPTLTFCLKCAVNVEFSILEKHLSQFHGEVLYDLPEKLSLNFKSPTTRYPPHIVVKYFKENIPQCNVIYDSVAYPIFQKTIAGLCCLLCRTVIHVDVFTHLSSQSHLNHLINTSGKRKRKLIKYHDYLAGLPSKYHEQMYYFNNSSTSSFFCLLCNVGYGKKKMTLHLESLEHISNLFQQLPAKASGSSNNKQNFFEEEPKEPTEKKRDLFKGNDIQELLFPQKINEFVRKLHCLDVDIIQAPTKDKFFCFLCQTETNDVVKHTSLPQHELKLLDHSSNVEPVRVYHEEWRKIDQQNRRFQGAFFPVTTSIVFCKICCFNVEYKKLDNHLKRCHNDSVYTGKEQ
ncbi:hypothetical protein QE152_g15792 [Popillia japonica]|uniref:DBF4-type domain-containing protein n=1 Tax=Popillia japonica TaxID=7064 RepID=A0AAW1L6R7_POPJA